MVIIFDPQKDKLNQRRHGISLALKRDFVPDVLGDAYRQSHAGDLSNAD